jgi:hypothetical protein
MTQTFAPPPVSDERSLLLILKTETNLETSKYEEAQSIMA